MSVVLANETKLRVFRDVLEDVLRDGLEDPAGDLGLAVDDAPAQAEAATHLDARSRHR